MPLPEIAERVLRETSRTFYIPIVRLPDGLREAVTSAYLCLRAIDEVEDHGLLANSAKADLLTGISKACRERNVTELENLSTPATCLPEVTKRLREWINLAPNEVVSRIWDVNAEMAERMASWANLNWQIQTKGDLDQYTFNVAGAVGVLLSELWEWFDGTLSDRGKAIDFGRGLQAVNILRNRREDLARGVDFFPMGWGNDDVIRYAEANLSLAGEYLQALPCGPAQDFCRTPLILAQATLEAMARGDSKLSRQSVLQLVGNEGLAATNILQSAGLGVPTCRSAETIILVDCNDMMVGTEEKMKAHELGIQHRAFSIFIVNSNGDLLLQRRSKTKYHSQELWSNTCCGHPRLGESIIRAGHRRLREEMGFDCELHEAFTFTYRAELENKLIENEYDHVLLGTFEGQPIPDAAEVDDWKWLGLQEAKSHCETHAENYTCWFPIAIGLVIDYLNWRLGNVESELHPRLPFNSPQKEAKKFSRQHI